MWTRRPSVIPTSSPSDHQVQEAEIIAPSVPPQHEWLFRRADVPDDELITCTFWEYMREVSSHHFGPKGLSEYAQRLLISYRTHEAQRKFNDSFDRIPTHILLLLATNPDPHPTLKPWQQLHKDRRQELNQSMSPAWKPLIDLDVFAVGLTAWELKMPAPGTFKTMRPWAKHERELYALALAYEARRRRLMEEKKESLDELPAILRSVEFQERTSGIHEFSIHDPRSYLKRFLFACKGS